MQKFWNWVHDDSGGRILRLEGPIDSESFWGDEITPQMFRDELYAEEGDITLWINSPGGNVFAAAEIYTMIRDYPGSVTVRIASIAASAASVVAMAGNLVQMSPTALLMVHDPSTIAMGNARDMEKAITTLNEVKESIINAYVAKTGLSRNRVSKLMSDETWLNAKKAVELGFADEILFEINRNRTKSRRKNRTAIRKSLTRRKAEMKNQKAAKRKRKSPSSWRKPYGSIPAGSWAKPSLTVSALPTKPLNRKPMLPRRNLPRQG